MGVRERERDREIERLQAQLLLKFLVTSSSASQLLFVDQSAEMYAEYVVQRNAGKFIPITWTFG